MAEALVIAGFLGLLVVLQVKDQKKIIVAAQTSWIRMGLSIALTVAILVIFWPSNLADQIKLGAFAAIILINGFLKEGLSQEGVVKLGVLNGEFARYPQIQIEELERQILIEKSKTILKLSKEDIAAKTASVNSSTFIVPSAIYSKISAKPLAVISLFFNTLSNDL